MSQTHIPEALDTKPLENFCLWETHMWDEIEEELAEMSGTYRVQNQVLPQAEWGQLYQHQMLPGPLLHQYQSEWGQIYENQGMSETHNEQYMPNTYFQHGLPSPLASPYEYHINPNMPNGNNLFTCYFWLGGPIDLYNIPGCSEYLPITISGDMKLIDIFDTYLLKVDAHSPPFQPRNLEFYNFMQIMFRDGKPQHGTQNYYQGAKWTGITVRETQWYAWQKFWLVGSDKEQAFLDECESAKTREHL